MVYCNDMPHGHGCGYPGTEFAFIVRPDTHLAAGQMVLQSGAGMRGSLFEYSCCMFRRVVLVIMLAGLAACGSTISARVTSFQQWPDNTMGASYRIVAAPAQSNNLEFQNYADMIRAAIGPVGLVETSDPDMARFDVHIDYANPVEKRWVQRYNDPYWDGWGFNPFFGAYSGYRGWGTGIYVAPSTVNVPIEVYKNTLTVRINDNQRGGAEVYRSTAISISDGDNLAMIMPYLAQAVFDGFPGNNGQIREVRYGVNR